MQRVLQAALAIAALAVAFVPRRKSPLQLAALSAALLMGFEFVLPIGRRCTSLGFPFLALAVVAGHELGGVVPDRTSGVTLSRRLSGATPGRA